MAVGTSVVWDEVFTAYDFGPTHPMAPVRLDLTTRPGAVARGARPRRPCWPPRSPTTTCSPPCTTATTSTRCAAPRPTPTVADAHRGLGTDDDPAFAGMHEASARIAAGHPRASAAACGRATLEHGVNYCGGLHHAMRGYAAGFCIYNDVARRHPVAARPRRAAGRLRRHRRAPRRRRRADVLERPAGAHDLGARERPAPLPRHRLAGRHRRPVGAGHGRQRRAAARHRRLGLAARDRVGRRRRWCGPSRPTCSSPSTAATPTCTTRWPTSPSPSTPSAAPTSRCTSWRTRWAAAAGSPSVAAATSSSRSCRGRGPT